MALPLTTLTFYRLADQVPAAGTLAAVIDAFYAALSATVDYRGTTLPATHQWTSAGRHQTAGTSDATYAFKPSGSTMLSPALLFCGAAAASPTMATAGGDSFLASGLHMGLTKNAGAYNAWDAAAPFTSGQSTGLVRAAPTTLNSTGSVIRMYVSQESIIVDAWSSATAHYPLIGGAIVEPFTNDTSNCCESDSRLYGLVTNGSGSLAANFLSSAGFFDHNTVSGTQHGMLFQPNTSSLYASGRDVLMQSSGNQQEMDHAGAFNGRPIGWARSTAGNTQNGKVLGRLREVYFLGSAQGARTLRNGSTDLFHVIGRNSSADDAAFAIKAAA